MGEDTRYPVILLSPNAGPKAFPLSLSAFQSSPSLVSSTSSGIYSCNQQGDESLTPGPLDSTNTETDQFGAYLVKEWYGTQKTKFLVFMSFIFLITILPLFKKQKPKNKTPGI